MASTSASSDKSSSITLSVTRNGMTCAIGATPVTNALVEFAGKAAVGGCTVPLASPSPLMITLAVLVPWLGNSPSSGSSGG